MFCEERTELKAYGISVGTVQIRKWHLPKWLPVTTDRFTVQYTDNTDSEESKLYICIQSRQQKYNHLLFKDNLKLYRNYESQISSLVNTEYTFWTQCFVVVLNLAKIKYMDGLNYTVRRGYGEIMVVTEMSYKYLEILQIDK